MRIAVAQEAEFTPDVEAHTRALSTIIANPDMGSITVAKDQGRVVGMVSLLFTVSTALGERVGLLEDMIVAPACLARRRCRVDAPPPRRRKGSRMRLPQAYPAN